MKAQQRDNKPKDTAREAKLIHMWYSPKLLERIDDFRFKNRFPTRKAAIEWLLEHVLDQKPKVE